MKKDRENDVLLNQSDRRIPSAIISEQAIAEKAPAAIRVLRERGVLDEFAEMLGLTPHLEGAI